VAGMPPLNPKKIKKRDYRGGSDREQSVVAWLAYDSYTIGYRSEFVTVSVGMLAKT
jgi:hypothetical protein